jgi:hypothetical protein
MIEPHCLTNGAMLRGQRFKPLSFVSENGFLGDEKWFLRNPARAAGRTRPSLRPVNWCAANACKPVRIPVPECVDMLRIACAAGSQTGAKEDLLKVP